MHFLRYWRRRISWAMKTAELIRTARIEPPCSCYHETCCYLHECTMFCAEGCEVERISNLPYEQRGE